MARGRKPKGGGGKGSRGGGGGSSKSFTWDGGELSSNLGRVDNQVRKAMVASAQYIAPQAESWAKSNAKWTDRTGNARNGLTGRVSVPDKNRVVVTIAHSVPYGIWLEVRWAGRYKIIEPTVRYFAPKAVMMVKKSLRLP